MRPDREHERHRRHQLHRRLSTLGSHAPTVPGPCDDSRRPSYEKLRRQGEERVTRSASAARSGGTEAVGRPFAGANQAFSLSRSERERRRRRAVCSERASQRHLTAQRPTATFAVQTVCIERPSRAVPRSRSLPAPGTRSRTVTAFRAARARSMASARGGRGAGAGRRGDAFEPGALGGSGRGGFSHVLGVPGPAAMKFPHNLHRGGDLVCSSTPCGDRAACHGASIAASAVDLRPEVQRRDLLASRPSRPARYIAAQLASARHASNRWPPSLAKSSRLSSPGLVGAPGQHREAGPSRRCGGSSCWARRRPPSRSSQSQWPMYFSTAHIRVISAEVGHLGHALGPVAAAVVRRGDERLEVAAIGLVALVDLEGGRAPGRTSEPYPPS